MNLIKDLTIMAGNIDKVQFVARGLGELKNQVVFIGGSVAELYADNPEISNIRPTIDVDCVVDLEMGTYLAYSLLEEKLRLLGFYDDTSEDAPICRKIYKGIAVDFMPVNPDILGFSNRWYAAGISQKQSAVLPDGTEIFILSAEYFLATKFEAMNSRGGSDIRGSHDWEDIVYVLDNCGNIIEKIKESRNIKLVEYLNEQFAKLLNNSNIREIIYTALPYNAEEEYIDKILNIIKILIIKSKQKFFPPPTSV
jgi:hypothetical protein